MKRSNRLPAASVAFQLARLPHPNRADRDDPPRRALAPGFMTSPGPAASTPPSEVAVTGAPVLGDWIWLFPLAYGAHIVDELWSGVGFPSWISELTGAQLTVERFVSLNTMAFVVMVVLVVLGRWWRPEVILVLGTVIFVNGLLHVGLSVVTWTHSPGLLTSLLAWLPLGWGTLSWGRSHLGRSTFLAAVVLGLLVHGGITVLALTG